MYPKLPVHEHFGKLFRFSLLGVKRHGYWCYRVVRCMIRCYGEEPEWMCMHEQHPYCGPYQETAGQQLDVPLTIFDKLPAIDLVIVAKCFFLHMIISTTAMI